MKNYILFVRTPLILICVYFFIFLLIKYGYILTLEELESKLIFYYNTYGLYIVAFLSLIENLPGVNAYFPGSIIILTAMAFTQGNPLLAISTYLVIMSFAFIGYHISYYIGLLSSNDLEKRDDLLKSNKSLFIFFFFTLWHPHSAAITCLASGTNKVPYKVFVKNLLIVGFIWNTFWAILMYNIGSEFFNSNGNLMNILIVSYLLLWFIYKNIMYFKEFKYEPNKN